MYKSWRTGEFFNSNNVDYLDFVVINKNLQKEKQEKNKQRRPIIITEKAFSSNSSTRSGCSTSSCSTQFKSSNLPFNYENVINKYKK